MWLLACVFGFLGGEPIKILAPEAGIFAGRTTLQIEIGFADEDVLGLEVVANQKQIAYFEAPPYETEIDFRDLPAGPIRIKAIVTLFDGRHFEASVEGSNHPSFYQEEVNLVRIPVLVTGGPEQGSEVFSSDDFVVRENDRAQKLERVLSVEQPLELLVMLDVSGSMDKRLITVRHGMKRLLQALRPSDRIQITGFNDVVFEVFPPGNDKEAALRSLNQLSASGETNLYGAIWSGVKMLSRVHLRRALVVFTDGRHELTFPGRQDYELSDCLEQAQEHGIPIYTMGCGGGIDPEVLGQLAVETGGKFFKLRGNKAIQAAFEEVGRELRRQYLVCYQTNTKQAGWHEISVQLKSGHDDVDLHYPNRLYIRRVR